MATNPRLKAIRMIMVSLPIFIGTTFVLWKKGVNEKDRMWAEKNRRLMSVTRDAPVDKYSWDTLPPPDTFDSSREKTF